MNIFSLTRSSADVVRAYGLGILVNAEFEKGLQGASFGLLNRCNSGSCTHQAISADAKIDANVHLTGFIGSVSPLPGIGLADANTLFFYFFEFWARRVGPLSALFFTGLLGSATATGSHRGDARVRFGPTPGHPDNLFLGPADPKLPTTFRELGAR
jgi:hypothetical protein